MKPSAIFDEWKDELGSFSLSLDDEMIQCWVTIVPHGKDQFSGDRLLNTLKAHGITTGLDLPAISGCSHTLCAGESVSGAVIATGIPPELKKNERIEFAVTVSTVIPEFEHVEGVEGCYCDATFLENVYADQVIATRFPAESGRPGTSVYGKMIPVPEEESLPPITLGSGVKQVDGNNWIATREGRVVFEDRAVWITDQLPIHSDVNYNVGNIDFVGFVHVQGGVFDGYRVRAKKGLIVDLEVDHSCVIESDGDIHIGGMTGGLEGSSIQCGGNVSAKYLRDVSVNCLGDLSVMSEVINCTIQSCGSVHVDGLIAGGSVNGRMGIEVGRAGTDAGVLTFLEAGVDYRVKADLERIAEQFSILDLEVKELEAFESDDSEEQRLNQEQLEELEEARLSLEELQRSIRSRYGGSVNAKVNINRCIYERVLIQLGQVHEKTKEYRKGEYSIIAHRNKKLAFLPQSPLSVRAETLEAELIEQEMAEFEGE